MQHVKFSDLGSKAYKETWDYQEDLLKENTLIKAACRNREEAILPAEIPTIHHLLFV
jgi:lipoyl(octanoyl) transferase